MRTVGKRERICSIIASVSMPRLSVGARSSQSGTSQVRERDAVVTADVEALAAVGDGAGEDRLPRTVVVARVALRRFAARVALNRDQVEDGGREAADVPPLLTRDVAGHR